MEGDLPATSSQSTSRVGGFFSRLFLVVLIFAFVLAASYFFPWKDINWGKVEFLQPETVTVIGTAKTEEKNQIATFMAGVSFVSDSKDQAVSFVNKKVDEIIAELVKFGIEKSDIKTENLSIYQQEEQYWDQEAGREKTRPGQWRASNNVSIILRDVDKASELADVLAKTGATNVYGPNFSLEDTKDIESSLLKDAIEDARKKAESIAASSGKKLGGIVSVSESGAQPYYPVYREAMGGGGGGAPVEPGSATVYKSVTVVFELK